MIKHTCKLWSEYEYKDELQRFLQSLSFYQQNSISGGSCKPNTRKRLQLHCTLYNLNMSQSIECAYQGEPGAYSQKACKELLGEAVNTVGLPSFGAVFEAVESGEMKYALIPIENSLGGSIHENFDLLCRYDLHINAEYDLRVHHCLVVAKGVKKEDINLVMSHPQALAQCDTYIRNWGVRQQVSYDTAGTAKMIKEKGLKNVAAICSSIAAEVYDMDILEENIEDDDNNYTRFLLLSNQNIIPNKVDAETKTSIIFSIKNANEPAALFKSLSVFALRDINLSKVESRPIKPETMKDQIIRLSRQRNKNFNCNTVFVQDTNSNRKHRKNTKYNYLFYVDFNASLYEEKCQNALSHLEEICSFVRVLGSFHTNGVLTGQPEIDFTTNTSNTADTSDADKSCHVVAGGGCIDIGINASNIISRKKMNIGVLGFGRFGQFLTKTLKKYANIFVWDRDNNLHSFAQNLGAVFCETQEQLLSNALDVLILSVSVLSFETVVKCLPMHLLHGFLVVDVLSVKTHARAVMKQYIPLDCDLLCTHPMFGPDSGRYSWQGLPFVYERVREEETLLDTTNNTSRNNNNNNNNNSNNSIINTSTMDAFLDIFESEGCAMVELSCEAHDAYAANSQFITHITGRMLGELKLHPTPINTRGFDTLLELVDNTCKDSFELFYALYQFNPNSNEQLHLLDQALGKVMNDLRNKNCKSLTGQESATNNNNNNNNSSSSCDDSMVVLASNHSMSSSQQSLFNPLVESLSASSTVYLASKVSELQRNGVLVHSLAVGEPDIPTPLNVLEATREAMMEKGFTKYTNVAGVYDLRKGISCYLSGKKGVYYVPDDQILCTNGAKQSVYQSLLCLVRPRDDVIIFAPYWVSYPSIVKLVGGNPVIVPTYAKDNYLIQTSTLAASITSRTRAIILCNPGNPTGVVQPQEVLQSIADMLNREENKHIFVVSDEIYERLVYDNSDNNNNNSDNNGLLSNVKHVSFASLDGMSNTTIIRAISLRCIHRTSVSSTICP